MDLRAKMSVLKNLIVFTVFILSTVCGQQEDVTTAESVRKENINISIIDNIMKGYNKVARPNFGGKTSFQFRDQQWSKMYISTGKTVHVNVSIFVNDISAISESEMVNNSNDNSKWKHTFCISQEFKSDFFIRQYWIDPRLSFPANLTEDNEITVSDEFLQKIWLPDSYYMNGKTVSFQYSMTARNTNLLRIRNDGRVLYSTRWVSLRVLLALFMIVHRVTVVSQCTMNFKYFPVDQQGCSLQLASCKLKSLDLKQNLHFFPRYRWIHC